MKESEFNGEEDRDPDESRGLDKEGTTTNASLQRSYRSAMISKLCIAIGLEG
jgi:hypothetical protein